MAILTWSKMGNITRLADEYALFVAKKARQEKEYRSLVARANKVSENLLQTRQIMRDIIKEIETAVDDQ